MKKRDSNIIERRLLHSYLSSIVSISLVLLLIGVFGMLMVNVHRFSNFFKENVKVTVILVGSADDVAGHEIEKAVSSMPQVKDVVYVSKDQGTKEMQEMLGEDFLNVFETNPIPISLEVGLRGEYFNSDSVAVFVQQLEENDIVEEVVYKSNVIDVINSNIEKIGIAFTVFVVLLLFISFVLINNTVRLNVFHKRFSIYTMKLVGATRVFIRAPFLLKAVFQGVLSGLIADLALLGILFLLKSEFAMMFEIIDVGLLAMVLGAVILLGVLICVLCTYFVINRLVALTTDELYY